MVLVRVAGLSDPAFQLNATALLHNVRGFVGGRVEVGRRGERDVVPAGERLRSHLARACSGGSIGVSLDAADVVVTEQALDVAGEGEGLRGAGDSVRGGGVHVGRLSPRDRVARCRAWRGLGELLYQGLFPGSRRFRVPRLGRDVLGGVASRRRTPAVIRGHLDLPLPGLRLACGRYPTDRATSDTDDANLVISASPVHCRTKIAENLRLLLAPRSTVVSLPLLRVSLIIVASYGRLCRCHARSVSN
jgi:hypothetical protein